MEMERSPRKNASADFILGQQQPVVAAASSSAPVGDRFPCESEFSSLLSHLNFGQIIHKINEINAAVKTKLEAVSASELREFEHAVEDNALKVKLPRIVVIGDEKSGKSSTVERVATVPVFPRQDEITMTRQPVLLKLRFSEHHPSSQPLYILTIPACRDSHGNVYNQRCMCDLFESTDSDEIIHRVRQQMEAIDQSDVGIESDCEIVVEVRSNGVPTMDMVDLPGVSKNLLLFC